MSTYNVKVYDLQSRPDRKGRPWRLRWLVDRRRFERRYATKALADSFRSKLIRAMNGGEPFDETSGLPASEVRSRSRVTWYDHALAYVEMKWPSHESRWLKHL